MVVESREVAGGEAWVEEWQNETLAAQIGQHAGRARESYRCL